MLSSPQGTPERVWSLVAGLAALGGTCDRQTFDALLNPGYTKDGIQVRAKDTLAADAREAAESLGLIQTTRDKAVLAESASLADASSFADYVHDHLSSLRGGESDSTILEAYSWVMAESDRHGEVGWLYELGREQFADKANAALVAENDGGKPMNTTKAPAWRRWLAFIGLGVALPIPNTPDFPAPTPRLARELERTAISPGTEMQAEQFLTLLSGRMPYIDRGRLFAQACQRIGHPPSGRRLSPLLSIALRDLHDDGTLQLILTGDASTQVQLTQDDAQTINAFTTVVFFPRKVQ